MKVRIIEKEYCNGKIKYQIQLKIDLIIFYVWIGRRLITGKDDIYNSFEVAKEHLYDHVSPTIKVVYEDEG